MTREDTLDSMLAGMAALRIHAAEKKEWLEIWRAEQARLEQDVERYRRKLSGEERQTDLELEAE